MPPVLTDLDPMVLVTSFQSALNRHDLPAALTLLSPDVRFYIASTSRPLDKKGVEELLWMFQTAFPDQSYQIQDLVVDGDSVCLRLKGSGTHLGPFQGMPPTSRTFETTGTTIYKVQAGQIVEIWYALDLVTLLECLQGQKTVTLPPRHKTTMVRRFLEAHGHDNLELLDEYLLPSYTHHDARMPLPEIVGRDLYKTVMQATLSSLADRKFKVQETFASGDRVTARWLLTGNQTGDVQGLPSSNKRLKVSANGIFRLRDGHIAEGWVNFDVASILRQLSTP